MRPTAPYQEPAAGTAASVELLVCVTCRMAAAEAPDAPRPGATLLAALAARLPEGVTIRGVECLSNCSRGCTVALRARGRWTYVYGDIDPDGHLDAVLAGVASYRDAPDGLVPWRARPEHFRKHCIARIPPLES